MLNPNDIANISLLKLEAALEENKTLTARVAELEAKLAQDVPALFVEAVEFMHKRFDWEAHVSDDSPLPHAVEEWLRSLG